MRKTRILEIFGLGLLILSFGFGLANADPIIADHSVLPAFDQIPPSIVEHIKTTYKIFYGHTSHGSQITTGMDMIHAENTIYDFNSGTGSLSISEYGDDLGTLGDTTWVPITRQALDQPGNNINMVIWSWCGGVSTNDDAGINVYLNAMNQLAIAYPNVTFIYMTGHLDGTGPAGELYRGNNQIRNYCATNNKILFDFADIESFDPDGDLLP